MDANIALLKNNLSRYLKAVRAGEEVVVLDRDTPIARIVPFRQPQEERKHGDHASAQIEAMVHRGAITHPGDPESASAWMKNLKPAAPAVGAPALSEVLLQLREEELW